MSSLIFLEDMDDYLISYRWLCSLYTGLDGGFTLVFDIRTFSLVVGCLVNFSHL